MLLHLATRIAAANSDATNFPMLEHEMGDTVWSEDDFDMPAYGVSRANGNERDEGGSGSDAEDLWCELD